MDTKLTFDFINELCNLYVDGYSDEKRILFINKYKRYLQLNYDEYLNILYNVELILNKMLVQLNNEQFKETKNFKQYKYLYSGKYIDKLPKKDMFNMLDYNFYIKDENNIIISQWQVQNNEVYIGKKNIGDSLTFNKFVNSYYAFNEYKSIEPVVTVYSSIDKKIENKADFEEALNKFTTYKFLINHRDRKRLLSVIELMKSVLKENKKDTLFTLLQSGDAIYNNSTFLNQNTKNNIFNLVISNYKDFYLLDREYQDEIIVNAYENITNINKSLSNWVNHYKRIIESIYLNNINYVDDQNSILKNDMFIFDNNLTNILLKYSFVTNNLGYQQYNIASKKSYDYDGIINSNDFDNYYNDNFNQQISIKK